ncbi:hypothetical protein [Brachybacterium tyrofermentans]|uniref:hypothetical protein n=1 Tax=Brachybacterium tyrofermentans TaxID=47848 RepID=UPI003FCEFC9D
MGSGSLHLLSGSAVRIACLALPEPSTRGRLRLDDGEIGRTVALSLLGQRRGDLGAHPHRSFFGLAEHGSVLVVLGPVCGSLSVDPLKGEFSGTDGCHRQSSL